VRRAEAGAAAAMIPNAFDAAASRRRCLGYRRRILEISQQVTALHVAPAFSCLEILDAVYRGLMRPQDVFVLSKGHGSVAQYVILEDLGVLARADLDAYCTKTGRLGAHPDYGVSGISASTGSLGHGMGMAAGMALAERLKGTDARVYAVLSDGECQEGSTWEAMLMAANLALGNLVALVDVNDFSGLDRMSEAHPAFHPLPDKARAFGWETAEVNGHDAGAVVAAVDARKGGRPLFVACRTVKGKGVAFMENVPIWHYRSPNKDEYATALAGLVEIGG